MEKNVYLDKQVPIPDRSSNHLKPLSIHFIMTESQDTLPTRTLLLAGPWGTGGPEKTHTDFPQMKFKLSWTTPMTSASYGETEVIILKATRDQHWFPPAAVTCTILYGVCRNIDAQTTIHTHTHIRLQTHTSHTLEYRHGT